MKTKDISNLKVNDLTAIKLVGYDKYKAAIWRFKCICGNYKDIVGSRVTNGIIKSCGCRTSRVIPISNSMRKLPNNAAAYNELFGNYKRDAKKRNIQFLLTIEQFKALISGECFYCGIRPRSTFKSIMFNGLDRVNNAVAYRSDNVVSCCSVCNRMKSDMKVKDFLRHIVNVANHINKINATR